MFYLWKWVSDIKLQQMKYTTIKISTCKKTRFFNSDIALTPLWVETKMAVGQTNHFYLSLSQKFLDDSDKSIFIEKLISEKIEKSYYVYHIFI